MACAAPLVLLPEIGVGIKLYDGQVRKRLCVRADERGGDRVFAANGDEQPPRQHDLACQFLDSLHHPLARAEDRSDARQRQDRDILQVSVEFLIVRLDVPRSINERLRAAPRPRPIARRTLVRDGPDTGPSNLDAARGFWKTEERERQANRRADAL